MLSNRKLFLRHLGQTSENPIMLEIESAKGIYLYDTKGKKYIDLISGISVSSLGHNNKTIKQAIKNQIEKHIHLTVYGEYIQIPQVKLAEYLVSLLPENLDCVYLVNSGSEAVEASLKLAKRYTRRSKIISFHKSYHGSTHGALSVSGSEKQKRSFRPLLPEVYHINLNNFEELELIDKKTACVIIEPIQAEAGVLIPDFNYIKKLKEKCENNGVLLIFDEIQTGFCRTGKMFGFEHFDINPDIVCFAKAFGGGMPIGAIVANKHIMDSFMTDPILGHITTFGGHPVCAAAALASMKELNRLQIIEKIEEKEKLFKNNLKGKIIKNIRGKGLLLAVELDSYKTIKKFIEKVIENGIITDWFLFNCNAFRIAPPLTITNKQILEACNIINKTLAEL